MSEINGTMSKQPRVLYLGPTASFSNAAALASFSASSNLIPLLSFPSIFTALQSDQQYYFAVLPIENSTNGSVVQVLDLLAECAATYHDLEVCGEHYLTVHHYLYAKRSLSSTPTDHDTLQGIKTLYTHPQVWGQCSRFLSTKLSPHVERIDVSSTSKAASLIAASDTNDDAAAICSSLAGDLNNLHCLASNIEDEPGKNTTRFFILRNRRHSPPFLPSSPISNRASNTDLVNTKSLITFTVPHTQPGSLSSALRVFAEHNFNLTRIDTRPSGQQSWHYIFFIECEERRRLEDDANLRQMVDALKKETERVWVGGNWKDENEGTRGTP